MTTTLPSLHGRFRDAIERGDRSTAEACLEVADVCVSYDWAEAHEAAIAGLPLSTEDTEEVLFSARGWLRAEEFHGWPCVIDERGGIWWPHEEATHEIAAARDPEAMAVQLAQEQPERGAWHC
ncbi:MAG TPA: hypothetical protein ENK57_19875 [Polyangiaceae bacterium]|nr:hypothetical protein [Polyangiaceae bacterium]